jgi:hypothetical protein
VQENILGSEFSFSTKTQIEVSIDYIPKIQARKILTFAKEQLEILKNSSSHDTTTVSIPINNANEVEEIETEEIINFAEIMPRVTTFANPVKANSEKLNSELSQDELFAKLQNYKKLLDNGLILQGEYDALKKEILSLM